MQAAPHNMQSALLHQSVVDEYMQGECALGRMLGPFDPGTIPGLHINRMVGRVTPKGHTPGKWRLITDLSFPDEGSVNDGIDPAMCSLQYSSVERVALAIRSVVELDIKSAYRLIPVHPRTTSYSPAWSGKGHIILIRCCHLGYAQPRTMGWSGF